MPLQTNVLVCTLLEKKSFRFQVDFSLLISVWSTPFCQDVSKLKIWESRMWESLYPGGLITVVFFFFVGGKILKSKKFSTTLLRIWLVKKRGSPRSWAWRSHWRRPDVRAMSVLKSACASSDWLITIGKSWAFFTRIFSTTKLFLFRSLQAVYFHLLGSYPALVSDSACSLVLGKLCITQPLVTASNWARRFCSNCRTKSSGTAIKQHKI